MKIDTCKWGNFQIGKLFEKLDLKILKPDFNKKVDVSLECNAEFNLPLVNARHFNNGIMFYGREKDFESAEMTIDIVQNGAIATGDVYAQPQKTGVLWDAYLIKPLWDCRSQYVLHYVACVIEKCIKSHFSWSDKCTWDKVRKEFAKLPIDENGNPDWKYMETYMKNVEKKVCVELNNLRKTNEDLCVPVKLDKWQEFQVGVLFPNVVKPDVYHVRNVQEDNKGIPYVVRSKFNNGIKYRVKKELWFNCNPAGVISFGAENASFFYQKEEWVSGRDMYYIDTRGYGEYVCKFLTSTMQTFAHKYGYNYGLFPDLVKKEKIKLPVDGNGQPDWKYMENYMKQIEKKVQHNLQCLQKVV